MEKRDMAAGGAGGAAAGTSLGVAARYAGDSASDVFSKLAGGVPWGDGEREFSKAVDSGLARFSEAIGDVLSPGVLTPEMTDVVALLEVIPA